MKRKQYGRALYSGMRKLGRFAAGMRVASKFRYKGPGSYTRTRNSRKGASYANITFQNDEAMIYRRKNAPRRVRRQRRRAMKNFMYRMDKLQSMKTCKIQWETLVTAEPTSFANGQKVTGVSIYGFGTNTYAANTNTGNGDMWWIFSRENGADPVNTLASRKLRFRSAVMDVMITNIADTEDPEYINGLAYIDIYHVLCRKNVNSDVTSSGDIPSFWDQCINEQADGNFPAPITNVSYYGLTPFDASGFGRFFKILKTRRVKLSAGQTFNTMIRDPGNYLLEMQDLRNLDQRANTTEGLIFVVRNPTVVGSIPGKAACRIRATKTYHYTEVSSSVDSIGQ
jgi:hypothetical protein